MSRVRYLAALAGSTERRTAPLLRPPRRLFPHELPPVEPLPEPQPAGETGGNPPTEEPPAARPEPTAPEPVGEASVEVVAPLRAGRLGAPEPPLARAQRVREVDRPQVEETSPDPQQEIEAAPRPPAPLRALREPDQSPATRRETRAEPKPVEHDFEPRRGPTARRPVTVIEPSRTRARAAAPPDRVLSRARGLHIGSIDVTVTPPPAAPAEPPFTASPTPVRQPPATFEPRGASMSRWFGLAQR
jgi:hypothetical protein